VSLNTRVDLSGMEALEDRLTDLLFAGQGSVEAISNFVAQSTAQRAKNLINNSVAAGRTYYRDNPRRLVTASAPGDAPANDLGYLVSTIRFKKYATGSAYAYVSAYYAADLEFGNPWIAARPFFYPSFLLAVQAGEKRFVEEFRSRL